MMVHTFAIIWFIAGAWAGFYLNEKESVYEDLFSAEAVPESSDSVQSDRTPLFYGEALETGLNEFASIAFEDGSEILISPQARILIDTDEHADDSRVRIVLQQGGALIMPGNNPDREFEIETGHSVALVQGAQFGVQASGFYWVENGRAEVMILQSGRMATLNEGMFGQIDPNAYDLVTGRLSSHQLTQLSNMVRHREESPLQQDLTGYVFVHQEP